jgi:hypothetical protein
MKNSFAINREVRQLEHRGGKKLGQLSTEFFHKKREVRKHPPRGFRGQR